MDSREKIERLLSERPGLKAQEIASELGFERQLVLAALHGSPGVAQDNSYRWWPVARSADSNASSGDGTSTPPTFLSRLCSYYLECLARESGPAISVPAASEGNDYVALTHFPPAAGEQEACGPAQAIRKIFRRVRRERGRLSLYVGYGIRLRSVSGKNEDELRIEPVLLYPLAETAEAGGHDVEALRAVGGIPLFNIEVLRSLPSVGTGNYMDEALCLSEELGFGQTEAELPPWDEIILRLRTCRPDWDWREDLNPWALSLDPPVSELRVPGIYNRAVLVAGSRSPFTYGLEAELRKLMHAGDSVQGTALAHWLSAAENAESPARPVHDDRPLLEVLPLNSEQRQAVIQGLSAPLTVVTGPPGTGKSQVVTALVANMAWQGSSVLFASKNNHAVDVVEGRVNGLGSWPLLLRLGREEHQARIAQDLIARLAESAGPSDQATYLQLAETYEVMRAEYVSVQRATAHTVELRNRADRMERAAEPARSLFDAARFAALRGIDTDAIRRRIDALGGLLAVTDPDQGVIRFLRDPMKNRRVERIAEAVGQLRDVADILGVPFPQSENNAALWGEFRTSLGTRLDAAQRVQAYWQSLDLLRAAKPIEQLALDLTRIAEESARNSRELWECWLRLWPSRWSPEQRRLLSEYASLLQMIVRGLPDGSAETRVFRRYYALFPKVAKVLPCWAVTPLSARGRLPFEPGIFDLVVIDEASQCDIASALPLLYRARRAVIIGDPLQLKHVSAVPPQQDRQILAAAGLADGQAAWAYSVNSLFDLARSVCDHDDIVNLRDHHRSHRDIIGFSNRHFYRGRLRIATDHATLNRPREAGPAVLWVDIKGKVFRPAGGGAVNGPEAQALVAEVRRLIVGMAYTGVVGVVTPFRAQADRIRSLLHRDPELSGRLTELRVAVDTVHGFQGDERDVIFFSPVVSPGAGESMLRFLKNQGNLFNVAITRARSELVVVGDREAALASGIGYLAGFAQYARDLATPEADSPVTPAAAGPDYPAVAHPDLVSVWEKVFYKAMYQAGLRPVPQYGEPPYALDFAVFSGARRLDIEVDGENYHRNWDGELSWRDQLRSRRLSDLGWDVMRFWVYEIRDDMEGSIRRVQAWVAGKVED